ATSVRCADADAAMAPAAHVPVRGSWVPCDGDADTSVSPGGSASCTTTPLASLGPRSVAVTVKVTVSPTEGAVRSTVFWMATSAAGAALSWATAESLLVSGSGSLPAGLVGLFVSTPRRVYTAGLVAHS